MTKNLNIKISIIILSIIFISGLFFINSSIGSNKFSYLKSLLNKEQKQLIERYIFPYKHISKKEQVIIQLKQTISQQKQIMYQQDIDLIELNGIRTTKSNLKLSNGKILNKYKFNSGFDDYGIHEGKPGTGWIDFYEENVVVISARGLIIYKKNLNDLNEKFTLIKNNISDFISFEQFNKSERNFFSLKDLYIFKNQIFVSYTEEIKEDCWNTSIIYGNMNYKKIKFKKLYSPTECIHSIKNIDKTFHPLQSGGRIISFDNNNILLSIGEYRSRFLAQDKQSVNGKIIKINLSNNDYEIISMGHRNPQGLYFDKENNFILETEHGPQGGDEINLIDVEKINEDEIQNYGWALSSAGEHYGGKIKKNEQFYEKYPLYKSHSEHGFIEPLKSFVPSIAISEIVKIGKNNYVVGSMGNEAAEDKSLYFFELNNQRKIINLEQVKIFERIRDLKFNNNQLYLYMESSASVGVINLN